ncbi:MAG: aminodeoxychorismate/anthranilate synthase component II [Phycisphaerales bacterium]|nr:aminodeoxychorismate/anthranilate synthase component II [Phycisphaerales bacterium]
MILLIDNYDSFTFNLVQRIGELDPQVDLRVVRNDEMTAGEIEALRPERIILSPGPCTPNEAGVCNEVVRALRGKVPILGVCLGHQCIGATHGMVVRRAATIMHGKTSLIHHDGRGLFAGLPDPFTATRYHSLIVQRHTVPLDEFEISAWTADDVVMGLRWKTPPGAAPLDGVQFHPESFLTTDGPHLLANFLGLARAAAPTQVE